MTRKVTLLACLSLLVVLSGTGGVTAQGPVPPGKLAGYANVVVVAKAGGNFTSIQDAVNNIPAGQDSRWLVWVAPGVYAERVHMKPFVDIAGAGEALVTITAPGGTNYNDATVTGANDAGLRDVTVENSGGADHAYAIYNSYASPRIQHVTLRARAGAVDAAGVFNDTNDTRPVLEDLTVTVTGTASGGYVYGVYNAYYTSPVMTRVDITAGGTGRTYGVYNHYYASPEMQDVNVVVTSGGDESTGIRNEAASSPVMERVNVRITAGGGWMVEVYGIQNNGGTPILRHVTVVATTPDAFAITGIMNLGTSPEMTDVTVTASGGLDYTRGVVNLGESRPASPVMIGATLVVTGNGGIASALYNSSGAPVLREVTASAAGGTENYGAYIYHASSSIVNSAISAGGPASVGVFVENCVAATTVDNSQIRGALNTISAAAGCSVRVGASQLAGGPVGGGGTVTCVGAYDENYTSPGYTVCP
jgi:hypothetical protein